MVSRLKIFVEHRIILAVITIIISLYLQTIPLANSLDFEFSAIMGICFFLVGGILFLKWKDGENIFSFFRGRFLFLLFIIAAPFGISLFNSIFLSVCPFGNGVLFYLFISIISLFLGIMTGLISKSIAGKHPFLIFSFFVFGFILISLLEIYFYPQIFTYNPIIGLFPGTVYDELIEFDSKLLFFRIYSLLLFTGFLYLIHFIKSKYSSIWLTIGKSPGLKGLVSFSLIVKFFVLYWICNLIFGFTIPISKIEKDLGGRLTTEHFVIIYPKEIPKVKVVISALHHEFYYQEISKALNTIKKDKIVSLLFASSQQKKKYIGSANADISKPWQNSVITDFDNHDVTLKHEIVHAFSADFGGLFLKLPYNINPVLLEGIAMAVEDKFSIQDIYSAAYMIRKFDKRISLEKLLGGLNFFGQASSVSYAYSGAFIKYLNENYGIEKFKELYTNPDFSSLYGKSLPELESEFSKFIDNQNYIYNPNRALLYFAGKPIFLKKCPRYVAYRMKKGNELFVSKDFTNSLEVYKDVYANSESNSALSGVINSLIRLGRHKEALEYLKKEIINFGNTTSIFQLKIQLADLYLRNEEYDHTREIYKDIIILNPHPEYVINAFIKLKLLEMGNNVIKKYVEGERKDRIEIILNPNSLDLLYRAYWLTGYGKETKGEVFELINKLDSYSIKDDIELFVVFRLSQYLKDQGDFGNAKKFAEKTLNYNLNDKGIRTLLEENLKKINFLINFKDTLIKKFVFN